MLKYVPSDRMSIVVTISEVYHRAFTPLETMAVVQ